MAQASQVIQQLTRQSALNSIAPAKNLLALQDGKKGISGLNKAIASATLRQVGVLYGHNGGGKVYNYIANANVRVGQAVTPEVTHPISGKTYHTLGRIVSTRDSLSSASQSTASFLSGKGIMLKTIGKTDQKSLPGYYSGWGKDAKAQFELTQEYKVLPGMITQNELGENVKTQAFRSIEKQIAKLRYSGVKLKNAIS